MSEVVDQAIIDWANDQLEQAGYERNAVGLRFGYWIGCYSSWTCDYGVNATIDREDGGSIEVEGWSFPDVLEALPQYVAAREAMTREHEVSHSRNDEAGTEVRF